MTDRPSPTQPESSETAPAGNTRDTSGAPADPSGDGPGVDSAAKPVVSGEQSRLAEPAGATSGQQVVEATEPSEADDDGGQLSSAPPRQQSLRPSEQLAPTQPSPLPNPAVSKTEPVEVPPPPGAQRLSEQGAMAEADEPPRTMAETPHPKVSEAPTELDLSTAPPASAAGMNTFQIKRATLVSEQGEESSQKLSLRKAESYVGYIIDGRYHILEVLAQGGMGVVYRGRHRVIDKAVAIKILRPELADNRDITQRFLTEAQAASAIGNEHIVDITDFGELPDNATYIVMEFLEGSPLSRHADKKEQLSQAEIIDIARQAAEGLQAAHDAGIVHRDLKPDNIFLTQRKGQTFVKVLDFGIAKVASSQNQITRAGHIFGTPHYMSPEQAKGDDLDNRSDIYAMGVILYELVSGQVPFDGENPLGILTQHMYTEPRPLHTVCPEGRVDAGFEAIVTKCLLKEPWQRYSTMEELDEDLRRVERGEPARAIEELRRLASAPKSLRKRLAHSQRRRWPWVVGPVVLAAGGLYAWSLTPDSPAAAWMAKARSALETTAPQAEPAPPEEAPETTTETKNTLKEVAMVLSPIDARVYRGRTDLGPMPLTVRIYEGQRVAFTVKRPGYASKRVVVDGQKDAQLVELTPLPGKAPPPPVAIAPTPSGPVRIITITDAGVTHHPPLALPDAGAPSPAPIAEPDAGARAPRSPATPRLAPKPRPVQPVSGPGADGPAPNPDGTASPAPGNPRVTPKKPKPPKAAPTETAEPSEDDDSPAPTSTKAPDWLPPVDPEPAPDGTERPIYEAEPEAPKPQPPKEPVED